MFHRCCTAENDGRKDATVGARCPLRAILIATMDIVYQSQYYKIYCEGEFGTTFLGYAKSCEWNQRIHVNRVNHSRSIGNGRISMKYENTECMIPNIQDSVRHRLDREIRARTLNDRASALWKDDVR